MPTLLKTVDFFAQHSPFGAFASFTVGRFGKPGGFGLELGGPPPDQDVYIGMSRSREGAAAFPFYRDAPRESGAKAYLGPGAADTSAAEQWRTFSPSEITRTLGWASDTWKAGDLTLSLKTPFCVIPDPDTIGDDELRRCLCPALFAEITLDNRASLEEAFAFFGIGAAEPLRPLGAATSAGLRGIARAGEWGLAAWDSLSEEKSSVRECLTWGLLDALGTASSDTPLPLHRLANRGALQFRAAPGESRTWTVALGFYRSGIVTTGIAATYLYTRLFPDLEAVLAFALENQAYYRKLCDQRDAELDTASLNEDRKFLLAHATRSYLGSTMLLHDERGALPRAPFSPTAPLHRPLWVVNEGEYRMLNTFDLTVDHAFWEMRYHPWTLKNTLDLFIGRYAYSDEAQDATNPERPRYPGGLSFTHDMGVANQFTPPGSSSYELADLDGCFSYMTQEQLCNWCLSAALYALPTTKLLTLPGAQPPDRPPGDLLWLTGRRSTLHACLESLIRRDGPDGARDGIMSLDSSRCGSGQEITTYDSLDSSLGQARGSLYLAVKTWAAYLALSRCFDALGEDDKAAESEEQAARAAAAITRHWDAASETFPAVLEPGSPGFHSRIIPAVEGLLYPYLLGDMEAVSPFGPFGELIANLRRHYKTVLAPGVCIDAESGGFKLSSSSHNTWMSKIFLAQFVAECVLGIPLSDTFDSVHAAWQRDSGCRDFAFTDQVHSSTGLDLGSRYYPRGVTSILWLL
ncbi:MAG: hypothetical protein H7Z41_07640 [Cytophagales bacterium]|nr:hypothetical protein [Armatimonadota bacterium]